MKKLSTVTYPFLFHKIDSPYIKHNVCKVFKRYQCGKYLVTYVLKRVTVVLICRLMEKYPNLTKQFVEDHFEGNLCRCTGEICIFFSILFFLLNFFKNSHVTQITYVFCHFFRISFIKYISLIYMNSLLYAYSYYRLSTNIRCF